MALKNMKISDSSFKERLSRFPPWITPTVYKLMVGFATESVPEKFICSLCKNIAFRCNKGCAMCFTYNCESCMAAHLPVYNSCPNPKCNEENPGEEYKSAIKMHPLD